MAWLDSRGSGFHQDSAHHSCPNWSLDIEVWIPGDGDRRSLQRLIEGCGLAGRVKLLGFQVDMVSLYQAIDLFVLSSLREGLPLVVLEAMATGVSVVATLVGGLPELIQDGVNGLSSPASDAAALASAMQRALLDGTLRQNMAAAGRAIVERDYTPARRASAIAQVYDRVLGIGRVEHPSSGPLRSA